MICMYVSLLITFRQTHAPNLSGSFLAVSTFVYIVYTRMWHVNTFLHLTSSQLMTLLTHCFFIIIPKQLSSVLTVLHCCQSHLKINHTFRKKSILSSLSRCWHWQSQIWKVTSIWQKVMKALLLDIWHSGCGSHVSAAQPHMVQALSSPNLFHAGSSLRCPHKLTQCCSLSSGTKRVLLFSPHQGKYCGLVWWQILLNQYVVSKAGISC